MTQVLKATLLGTGSSGGVPRVGGDWGACDPGEPKNRRRRCSLLVETWAGKVEPDDSKKTIVLIDTSPDLREQLLDTGIRHIDAVLFTHEHADQTNGMDDLRAIAYRGGKRIPAYMDAHTKKELFQRFKYCFVMPEGRIHPPILDAQAVLENGQTLTVSNAGGDLVIDVIEVGHGNINALGFIFGGLFAYTPDAHMIDDQTFEKLDGIDTWIVDTLRYHVHPTHAHADKALYWSARAHVRNLVLTNMHIDMDYRTLLSELPGNQTVGFDGLVIKRSR